MFVLGVWFITVPHRGWRARVSEGVRNGRVSLTIHCVETRSATWQPHVEAHAVLIFTGTRQYRGQQVCLQTRCRAFTYFVAGLRRSITPTRISVEAIPRSDGSWEMHFISRCCSICMKRASMPIFHFISTLCDVATQANNRKKKINTAQTLLERRRIAPNKHESVEILIKYFDLPLKLVSGG